MTGIFNNADSSRASVDFPVPLMPIMAILFIKGISLPIGNENREKAKEQPSRSFSELICAWGDE